jgi:predicted nucleic acid-binding protein
MSVFVDTSAFFAVLDADDRNHTSAGQAWRELIEQEVGLVSTNYVLLETLALVRHRLGMEAVRTFQDAIVPLLRVEWVTEARHASGVTALLIVSNRGLSLVDCVSFETMRRLGTRTAFAFDRHFSEQGFTCIPAEGG